jgi:hypothetical protein
VNLDHHVRNLIEYGHEGVKGWGDFLIASWASLPQSAFQRAEFLA